MLHADPGATVVPAREAGTELLLLPVTGSGNCGVDELAPGSIRMLERSVPLQAINAGPDRMDMVVLVADQVVSA